MHFFGSHAQTPIEPSICANCRDVRLSALHPGTVVYVVYAGFVWYGKPPRIARSPRKRRQRFYVVWMRFYRGYIPVIPRLPGVRKTVQTVARYG
jgi:hypothetical protein